MRTLPDVLIPSLLAESVQFCHLIELDYWTGAVEATLRMTDAPGDVLADVGSGPVTFAGAGEFLGWSGASETPDRGGQSTRLALTGVDQSITATLLNNDFRNRGLRIWRAYLAKAENRALYSEQWDHGTYITAGAGLVVTPDQGVGPFGGAAQADKIADADAVSAMWVKQQVTAADDSEWRWASVFVEKTASRTYGYYFEVGHQGAGTQQFSATTLDTHTGEIEAAGTSHTVYGVEDFGTHWRLWVAIQNNNTGNTIFGCGSYPAYRVLGSGYDTTLTGDQVVFGLHSGMGQVPSVVYQPTVDAAISAGEVVAVLSMFTGLQSGEYRWEEERDPQGQRAGTVKITTRVASRLSTLQLRRPVLTSTVSHNNMLKRAGISTGDTFFQNMPAEANRPSQWGDRDDWVRGWQEYNQSLARYEASGG